MMIFLGLTLLAILALASTIRSAIRWRRSEKFWDRMDERLQSGRFDCNDAARIITRDMGEW